tara:strand:- start:191 stop:487 length:297 start_codon:yes stop_codon:yes gene_type:complete
MSLESKIDRLKKVTALFDKYVEEISSVRSNIDSQAQYAEGYAACLSDILEALKEDKETEIIQILKTKIDMDSRKKVLEELSGGLVNLQKTYNSILSEE